MNEAQINTGLRKRMLLNTISNYCKVIIGIFITIFLTRILFLGLSREEYGFWALLWSIYGYSLLLDFGFGASVQKYTSETIVKQDWDKYNRIISTIFFNYIIFAGFIALFSIILSLKLDRVFSYSPQNNEYFRRVLLMFGIGSAIVFPFGFFTEVLRGLQKMHFRNIIQITFMTLNFIAMAIVVKLKLSLVGMTYVAIGTNLLSCLTMMTVSYRLMPEFHIRLKYYDRSLLRSVMGFSFYAYLISFTNVIILKTDQMVISVFGTVALVAIYQISIRLAETYQRFSAQFLDNLGPVSASLFATGNKSKMADMMLQSNRLMGIISTMLLIPLLAYVKPLLRIWLNLNDTSGTIVAIILLLSMYTLLFFRSSSVYILLMANEQKILSRIAIVEAIANLGLSILLILTIDNLFRLIGVQIPNSKIIGVALGTLIPNIILAFSFNIPKACHFSGITLKEYFNGTVKRTVFNGLCSLAFAWGLSYIYFPQHLLHVFIYCLIVIGFYLILTYVNGLEKWERKQLDDLIKKGFIFRK